MTIEDVEVKAPQDVVLDLPQEAFTGDVLRGYGPRRGNLERLLRYWRPIMRKPGGFRRCRVILANHPELYPTEYAHGCTMKLQVFGRTRGVTTQA